MTALVLVAIGLGFAVCALVTTSATSSWNLYVYQTRRRRRAVIGFIAAAAACQTAAAVWLLLRGWS